MVRSQAADRENTACGFWVLSYCMNSWRGYTWGIGSGSHTIIFLTLCIGGNLCDYVYISAWIFLLLGHVSKASVNVLSWAAFVERLRLWRMRVQRIQTWVKQAGSPRSSNSEGTQMVRKPAQSCSMCELPHPPFGRSFMRAWHSCTCTYILTLTGTYQHSQYVYTHTPHT